MQSLINHLLKQSHGEEGWITPLPLALEGVSPEEAAWKPALGVASISELTAHAVNYQNDLIRDLRGEAVLDHEDWPAVEAGDASRWEDLKAEAIHNSGSISELAANAPDPKLLKVVEIAVHDSYHAGQVMKLRQLWQSR